MELRRSMTTLTGIHWSNDRPFVIKGDSIFTPSRAGSEGIRVIPSSTSPAIFADSSYASEDIISFGKLILVIRNDNDSSPVVSG